MNTIKTTYIEPGISIIDIQVEGILCQSEMESIQENPGTWGAMDFNR